MSEANGVAVIRDARVESWEDHVEAWHALGRQVDGAAWGRAAIAASLKRHYGDGAIEKFAKEVRFAAVSVWRFVKVHETFGENYRRREFLKFKHYEEALAADDPVAALDLAEREGWSANALRAHLRPPVEPALCAPTGDSCGVPSRNDKAFHVVSLVESITQSMNLFEAVKGYNIDPLFERRTKKSVAEFAAKLDSIIRWLQALQTTVNGRK